MGKRTYEAGIVGLFLLYVFGKLVGTAKGMPTMFKPLSYSTFTPKTIEPVEITAEHEESLMEAAEAGGGVYMAGINLPVETDWTTRLQDYSQSGGQMIVDVQGDYAYVHMVNTEYSDPDLLGGPYRTPQKIYIGSHGYQYALIATAASVPIWSGVQYGDASIGIGSRTNIEFLSRFKTNP